MVAVGSKDEVLALLCTLKPDLAERFAINQIGIFGSVARNEARQDSDIDVVVHMQPNMLKRVRLKAELEGSSGSVVETVLYDTFCFSCIR